jgi:23S rRNA (uracil1939-C5)-methyltransferase
MKRNVEAVIQIPGCEISCPACPHRYWTREQSLEWKEQQVEKALPESWKNQLLKIVDTPEQRWGYRHKVSLHVRLLEGEWKWGLLRRNGREKELVFIPDCPVQSRGLNEILREVAARVPKSLPWFAVIAGEHSLTLVMKTKAEEPLRNLLKGALQGFSRNQLSLWVCWHPNAGLKLVDPRYMELLAGPERWKEEGLWAGPLGFRQQLPSLAARALNEAEAFFDLPFPLVDLFCGRGEGLVRWVAKHSEVWGVELGGESVALAKENAPGAKILRGRVEHRLGQIYEELKGRDFYLYGNPPRTGLGPELTTWIQKAKPVKIAYLSCSPRTAAEDIAALSELYRPHRIQPFDFIPQTRAVECLFLLERK